MMILVCKVILVNSGGSSIQNKPQSQPQNQGSVGGILDLDLMGDSTQPITPGGGYNNMMDLMGEFPPMTPTPAVSEYLSTPMSSTNHGTIDFMELDSLATPTNLPKAVSQPAGGVVEFDFLGGSPVNMNTGTPISQPNHTNQPAHDDFEFDDDFQAPSTAGLIVPAFMDENIVIKFVCRKADGNQQRTIIDVTYDNLSYQAITGLDLKLSPAKHLTLAAFNPLGIASLSAGARNVITHHVEVVNSMQGQKAIAIKLQTSYSVNGNLQTKQNVVTGFQANY